MKAYSLDLRQKIVDRYDTGEVSQRQLARQFGVALSFIEKLLKQRRETGSIAPKVRQTPPIAPKLNPAQLGQLQDLVAADNDATLAELQIRLAQQTGISVSVSTVDRLLRQLGITRKKKRFIPAKKQVSVSNDCVTSIGK
jgi:transposase